MTSVAEGENAAYSSTDQAENDPKKGDTWDKSRSPNINIIIWLCTDKEAISYLTHRGISITGAKIDGCLDVDFIELDAPLIFNHCYLTDGIKLESARVKLLNFSGSYIASHGYAIFARSAEVKRFVVLDDGCQSKGGVSFYGTTIGGNFEANTSIFDNPNGITLIAQGVDIKGSVYLRDGVESKGLVYFYGATIGGNFSCSKGSYYHPNGHAIVAQDVEIKGSVFLDDGFEAKGEVSFYNANIWGTFLFSKVKNIQEMTLDLTLAKINSLSDKENSWPEKTNLYLDGLVYNSIDNNCPVDSQSRLKWIRLQNLENNFSPQPYEQLAKVFRMSGHEEAATEILIAKQNDRRRYGEFKGFRWVLNFILGLTIDHGYRPQKILIAVLVFLILGWGIVFWGESQHLMSPSRIIALVESLIPHKIVDPNSPKFNAFMYSVDAFLPILDFYQESYWLPNANKKDDIKIPLNYSNTICYKNAWIGSLLRYYLWFHIFMGWVLTSLAVAGFTGLVRRLG